MKAIHNIDWTYYQTESYIDDIKNGWSKSNHFLKANALSAMLKEVAAMTAQSRDFVNVRQKHQTFHNAG